MIISRTPVRISFFGGGTDYPIYYNRFPGAVLGTAINKHVYISLNVLGDFFSHRIRIGYSQAELINYVDEIKHPSVRHCLKYKNIHNNLDIHIFSDLPAKTGLGSSSSCTVGFLNALHALEGKKVSKQKLAEEACFVEQDLIQENVGSQDQFHAAFGGFNIIEFKNSQVTTRPFVISKEKLEHLQEHMLVFYTGLTRFASEILEEQIIKTKTLSNDEVLQKMYSMVYEAENLASKLSKQEFVQEFGKLLDESWKLKKQLSSKISNDFIDDHYNIAKDAGAYGGKICGAGGGGFLVLFVPSDRRALIREKLKVLLEVDVRFENEGSSIIYMRDS